MPSQQRVPPGRHAPPRPTRAQLERVAREVEATAVQAMTLPRPVLASMAPVLAQTRREVARDLTAWLARQDAAERFTAQKYRNLLVQLEASFAAIRRLAPALVDALSGGLHGAAAMAVQHVVHELARFSAVFGESIRSLPIQVAAVVAHGDSFVVPRFERSAARYPRLVQDDIKRELAVGVVRGESVTALAERIARVGGFKRAVDASQPATGSQMAGGLFTRYDYWAERIVRTEVMSAYNACVDQSIRQVRQFVPDVCRRWDASLDMRVCQTCAGLNGAVAGLSEDFPGGYATAPAHPNCRCRVGAWRREWAEILAEAN